MSLNLKVASSLGSVLGTSGPRATDEDQAPAFSFGAAGAGLRE